MLNIMQTILSFGAETVPLYIRKYKFMANKKLNRLKIVLAEKEKSNNWLAEQLGKDKTTVSKWCTNTCQPDLATLMQIAKLLDIDLNDLVRFDDFKRGIK